MFTSLLARKEKIKRFGNGYQLLQKVIQPLQREVLFFRARRNVWNINEIVIHIADLEAGAYVNFRRAIAEPTETIFAFDKDLWVESLGYYSQPLEASLKLFRLLRASNYLLLKNIPSDAWLNTVNYQRHGQISLEDLMDLYDQQLSKAFEEIEDIHSAWKKQQVNI
ncbi:MAG: hypothetical protein H0W62_10050 [Chitinophagales bacterium]|nr:hypothetical protein [Chitinophagales bacterium]